LAPKRAVFAALVGACVALSPAPAPRSAARRRFVRVASAAETAKDKEENPLAWRSSVTSADFDDALVYRLFRKQFDILLPGLVPKQQLAVSARRGKASLRKLRPNATALNRLFNPMAANPGFPLQLTGCACEGISIAWTSVFTLNRDPLEVRVSKAVLDLDQNVAAPSEVELRRAQAEWDALNPAPQAFMREHPTVEGSRFLVDELVCYARRVETPSEAPRVPRRFARRRREPPPRRFARGKNATLRLTLTGVDARSVDNASAIADLRRCWTSFNPRPARSAFIAKRIVAKEAVLEMRFDPDADDAAAAIARVEAEQAAAVAAAAADAASAARDESEAASLAARLAGSGIGPSPSDLEDLFPRADAALADDGHGGDVVPVDPLRVLRRTVAAPWTVRAEPPFGDRPPPPEPGAAAAAKGRGFFEVARAPDAAALLTLGYDSPRARVASVRCDLDLRRLAVSLDADALREKAMGADDVAVAIFATLGTDAPAAPGAARRQKPDRIIRAFAAALNNRVLRPALAIGILAWGAGLL